MKRLITVLLSAGLLAAVVFIRPAKRSGPGATEIAAPAVAAGAPVRWPKETIVPAPVVRPPERSLQLVNEIARALRLGGVSGREHAFKELLPELIARNAADAGWLAEEWEPGPLREELLREVTRLWTAEDFAGAMTWLAGLESRRDQGSAARAAAAELSRTDPAGAIEVSQIFQVGTGDGSLEHMAQLWTEESPREAEDWILSRPAGLLRDRLLARIAYVRAQSDPVEAAALAMNFIPAGATRDDAVAGVSRQWAVRDPVAATAWVEQFPAGPMRTRALAEVAAGQKLR